MRGLIGVLREGVERWSNGVEDLRRDMILDNSIRCAPGDPWSAHRQRDGGATRSLRNALNVATYRYDR
jgi:hypothetical protein